MTIFLAGVILFLVARTPRLLGAVPITAGQSESRPTDVDVNRLLLAKRYLVNVRTHALMRATPLPAGEESPYEISIAKLNRVWGLGAPRR